MAGGSAQQQQQHGGGMQAKKLKRRWSENYSAELTAKQHSGERQEQQQQQLSQGHEVEQESAAPKLPRLDRSWSTGGLLEAGARSSVVLDPLPPQVLGASSALAGSLPQARRASTSAAAAAAGLPAAAPGAGGEGLDGHAGAVDVLQAAAGGVEAWAAMDEDGADASKPVLVIPVSERGSGRLDALAQFLDLAVDGNGAMSDFGRNMLGYAFRPAFQDGSPPDVFKIRTGTKSFAHLAVLVEPEHELYESLDMRCDFQFAYGAITTEANRGLFHKVRTKAGILEVVVKEGPQCIIVDTMAESNKKDQALGSAVLAAYVAGFCRMNSEHVWVLERFSSTAARARLPIGTLRGGEVELLLKLVGHGYKYMHSTLTNALKQQKIGPPAQ